MMEASSNALVTHTVSRGRDEGVIERLVTPRPLGKPDRASIRAEGTPTAAAAAAKHRKLETLNNAGSTLQADHASKVSMAIDAVCVAMRTNLSRGRFFEASKLK